MQSRSHANGKIGKILVVEDYEPIRDMICEALRENGYEPVPAASIAEATDILFAEQPAVVIADLFMPGDDVSFISAVKRADPKRPVIVISSASDDAVALAPHADLIVKKGEHVVRDIRRAIPLLLQRRSA